MHVAALPKISIVMPVLNRAKTIEKAIQSALNQQYHNIEFIIIDGGSTDGTVEIIKRYEKHLAYWHSKPDRSPAYALNAGIAKATGDLVALLMSDDWFELGTLQKIGEAFVANPDADMFTCGGRIVYFDEESCTYKPQWIFATPRSLELTFYNICFAASAICCRFIKKSLYDQIGLYPTGDAEGRHTFSGDKELLLRAVLHHAKDVFVDHMGVNYFAGAQSSTFGNNRANIIRLCEEHMVLAKAYLREKKLSSKQKWLLLYWYNDQSVRLLWYRLLAGDLSAVFATTKNGFEQYKVIWPVALCITTMTIIIKRSWRWLHKLRKCSYAKSKAE